jgi:hypothetical protein
MTTQPALIKKSHFILSLRDLSHLVQEIPIETNDYEGLRSVGTVCSSINMKDTL